jgi:hypothetical protein
MFRDSEATPDSAPTELGSVAAARIRSLTYATTNLTTLQFASPTPTTSLETIPTKSIPANEATPKPAQIRAALNEEYSLFL